MTLNNHADLGTEIERLGKTAMRIKEQRDWLYTSLKELVRCVRGGDETAGVSMDDALIDADESLREAEL